MIKFEIRPLRCSKTGVADNGQSYFHSSVAAEIGAALSTPNGKTVMWYVSGNLARNADAPAKKPGRQEDRVEVSSCHNRTNPLRDAQLYDIFSPLHFSLVQSLLAWVCVCAFITRLIRKK